MALFNIIVDKTGASDQVIGRIKEHYTDNYFYHGFENLIFIRSDEISEKIAVKIGLKGDNKIKDASGAVFKMNANYSGFTDGAIWEWLSKDD